MVYTHDVLTLLIVIPVNNEVIYFKFQWNHPNNVNVNVFILKMEHGCEVGSWNNILRITCSALYIFSENLRLHYH